MTETLVQRLEGIGGSEFRIGLKKVLVRSSPPGPKDEPDPLFAIITNHFGLMIFVLFFFFSV